MHNKSTRKSPAPKTPQRRTPSSKLIKTCPGSAKSTKRGVNQNWRKVNGKLMWPNEMKLFLVSRIKEHISVLEGGNSVDTQLKARVWDQILKALMRRGMPEPDVRTVKKVWSTLRTSTIEVYRRVESKRGNVRNPVELTELHRAVHEVIELSNKLKASGNSVMPMPMKIKTEPVDPDDAIVANGCNGVADAMAVAGPSRIIVTPQTLLNASQRHKQNLQLRSTPVVLLRPLIIDDTENEYNMNNTEQDDDDDSTEEEPEMPAPRIQPKNSPQPSIPPTPPPSMPTPPPSVEEVAAAALAVNQPIHAAAPASENEVSPDCRRIYDRIAEAELKIKLLQVQKEEQTLEFERELHARRVAILDADLRKKNLEVEYLVRSHQPVHVNNNLLPME